MTINLENGKIIVQELDTPKIRREKARQRKAEKAAAAAAAQSAAKAEVAAIRDDASDLSSLSDLESERGDDNGGGNEKPVIPGEEITSKMTPEVPVVATRRVPRGPAALITTGSALILLEPGERLEGGTLGTLA